jgi:hypothetical protein
MAGNKLATLAFTLLLSHFVDSADFTYENQGDDWTGDLCSNGKSQSPINIDTDDVVEVDSSDGVVEVVTTFNDFDAVFIVKRGSPSYNDQENAKGLEP